MGELLLRPVLLLLVPEANRDKEGTMRKRLRGQPRACQTFAQQTKDRFVKPLREQRECFLRAWLWGRYRTKGSRLARGRICRFHPKAAGASLANNALPSPGDRLGRRREQLIGMGLPDKGFARSETLVFPLLLAPNIQMSWARATSKL